jgi:leader peptidase (prepilin peptidase)/N-methyltransferase
MSWWYYLPAALVTLWVFVFGLVVGSFLTMVVARLPFEKSVVWPAESRCFSCLRPLKLFDNLPIIGYLRLRGRCRFCHTPFSSRYLWVELGTGLGFVALFWLTLGVNWHRVPGLRTMDALTPFPPPSGWAYFAAHASLFALLFAAAVIDLKYRVIPPPLTVVGTLLGLAVSTACPWPWPGEPSAAPGVLPGAAEWGWTHPDYQGRIPVGIAVWPVWGPTPDWAPPGSWQLGLLTGLTGAAVGMFVGRAVRFLFELGFGQEALGLGDADLMMMAGSFLGWQVVALALPAGAAVLLPVVLPLKLWAWATGRAKKSTSGDMADDPWAVPFGPGIAAGILVTWAAWPWLGELVRPVFFSGVMLGFVALFLGGGLLVCGLVLRRGPAPSGPNG